MRKCKAVGVVTMVFLIALLSYGGLIAQADEVPTYKFGIDAAWPPWSWVEKGETKGFEIELFEYIGELEGFNVKFVDLPWETIISALSKGKIDMLGGGLAFTCERALIIDYALSHWRTSYWVLVRKDSELNGVTALSGGARVGAEAGSTDYRWVQEELIDRGVDVELVGYTSTELALKDLEIGRLDSIFMDFCVAHEFMEAGRDIKVVGKDYTWDLQAFGVTPGDPHNLIPKINDGIRKACESGKWAELMAQYFPWAPVEPVPLDIDYVELCIERGEPLPEGETR